MLQALHDHHHHPQNSKRSHIAAIRIERRTRSFSLRALREDASRAILNLKRELQAGDDFFGPNHPLPP